MTICPNCGMFVPDAHGLRQLWQLSCRSDNTAIFHKGETAMWNPGDCIAGVGDFLHALCCAGFWNIIGGKWGYGCWGCLCLVYRAQYLAMYTYIYSPLFR